MGHNKPHSIEAILKCSEAQKKRWADGAYKNRPPISMETKKKISNTLQKGKWLRCLVCDEIFYVSPSRGNAKYCSQACNGKTKTEENNHNWNGGSSRAYKTGYHSHAYKNWRKKVFIRDNFTCQGKDCDTDSVYITAHHILSFANYPELRFDVNNGITLCKDCHSKTDNYKGRNRR